MASATQTCARCASGFDIRPEDTAFYEKINVPPPTFCPDCRAKRRMIFWNQHNLFRKKEVREGKEIFSGFPEAAQLQIYDRDYWWSDAWDPMEYGQEIDWNRPFLEQLKELYLKIPYPSRSVRNLVRSDYCNQANDFKDSYLCFDGDHAEECMYGSTFFSMRNCLDFYAASNCELSYEIFSAGKCYRTAFAFESSDNRDCWFLSDCSNLDNCIGCVNLGNKQYYILNQPYSKEEYEKKKAELDLGSWSNLKKFEAEYEEFKKNFPVKYAHAFRTVNTVGEFVYDAKNAYHCYEGVTIENSAYCNGISERIRDCMDYTNFGDDAELMYESAVCGDKCRGLKFCFDCWPGCQDLEYSINCHSASNCFGSVGLTKKQYCILNKQYSKEDYEALVPKIREHMKNMPYKDSRGITYSYGEFFPEDFSPLAYNESAVQDHYPLTEEKANATGYLWRSEEKREFTTTKEASDLPDHIKDVADDIVQEVIRCTECNRAYRILASELGFYRRLGLPLPRSCHRCRLQKRLRFRMPLKWHHRKCMCGGSAAADSRYKNNTAHEHGEAPCPIEFESSYAPDRPEIVYCEKCYQTEVA